MDEEFEEELTKSSVSKALNETAYLKEGNDVEKETFVQTKLFSAIFYACMRISDDVTNEVREQTGEQLEFDGSVIAQTARIVMDALSETWPGELITFAKHGKRSVINVNDLILLFRKNESLISFINAINGEQTTKRPKQPLKEKDPSGTRHEDFEKKTALSAGHRKNRLSKSARDMLPSSPRLTSIKKFLPQPSTSKSPSMTVSVFPDITSKVNKRKSCFVEPDSEAPRLQDNEKNSVQAELPLQTVKKMRPPRSKDFMKEGSSSTSDTTLSNKSFITNVIKKLDLEDIGSGMNEASASATTFKNGNSSFNSLNVCREKAKNVFSVEEPSKSEENSCDVFDGIDWDAIDKIESRVAFSDKFPTTENSMENEKSQYASNDFSAVTNALDGKKKAQTKISCTLGSKTNLDATDNQNRNSFTAFHFESDDEDALCTVVNNSHKLAKFSVENTFVGDSPKMDFDSAIGGSKVYENGAPRKDNSIKDCNKHVSCESHVVVRIRLDLV